MAPCTRSAIEEEQSSCNWQHVALHKNPRKLCSAGKTSIARSIVNMDFRHCKDNLRNVCHSLKTSYPLNLRTAIVEEVVALQKVEDSHHVLNMILLHLLTDVRTFVLTTSPDSEESIYLGQEDCELLLMEVEDKNHFLLESIRVSGVVMEQNIISEILRRSPRLHTIQVSGEICSQVLASLEKRPRRSLRALQLDNTSVNERQVMKALLGSQYDLETLGKMMCEGKSQEEISNIPHQNLKHLSVDSPFIGACGAVVLLHYLRNLRSLRYAQPAYKSLLFLQHLTPSEPLHFALTSTELWRPTSDVLLSLQRLCPDLRHLMIESTEGSSRALQLLSSFTNLESLTLRNVPEADILLAIKSVGANLHRLSIEYETLTSISYEVIKAIQATFLGLRSLEMANVHIDVKPEDLLSSMKHATLPELTKLKISQSDVHPSILERLLVGNSCLDSLHLDISQDAMTEQLLITLLKYNSFQRLSSIYLGAGTLSQKGISRLMVLPSLEKLSVAVESFPRFSRSDFDGLRKDLTEGNFRCVLESVVR
ncbi:uncharacterized protein LOC135205506 [Macrobrachium nipponense]|uniref:uncharacterized protein LOC135205506 n=1 Tax=Macrobrachium nipponense TaxID=159736 RepID=UPI0030C88F4D